MKKITSLLLILISSIFLTAYGQSWKSVSTGTSAPVQAMKVDPATNLLYVGGAFSQAGGLLTGGIAKWDGSLFSALGSDLLSGSISSMTMQNGDLIVGGTFSGIGGILANNVAKWNGIAWLPMGSGLNYTGATTVSTLCVYNGDLYAGGTFLSSGLTSTKYIARWNGLTWQSVGAGMNGPVKTLCVYNGELYAGGSFTSAGGASVNNIAKWNGTSWSSVGGGLNYTGATTVSTLCVYNNELYAGGTFNAAGTTPVNNIARWNGSTWKDVGGGVTNYTGATTVSTLCVFSGKLVAGGTFSSAGIFSASNIGKWNGSSWSSLGTGTDNSVKSLEVYGNTLYAGGEFLTAGGVSAPYVAEWGGNNYGQNSGGNIDPTGVSGLEPDNNIQVYPNPADNKVWIKVGENVNFTLTIFDILGKEVFIREGLRKEAIINRENIPSGTYIYKITGEDGAIIKQGLLSFK